MEDQSEAFEEINEKIDHASNSLDHYKNIIELTGRASGSSITTTNKLNTNFTISVVPPL